MLKRWLLLAAVVIAADQYTKWLVLQTLRLGEMVDLSPFFAWTLTFNAGASFSFLAGAGGWQRWLFTALALAVSGWVLVELRRHASERLLSFALTLIMGGALGNVIDRIRFGAVVDFILVHGGDWYFPAFNVADSAISVGAVLLVWEQIRQNAVKDQPAA